MKLIVVRHGETEANINKILNGGLHEDKLTAKGQEQARLLIRQLTPYKIDRIYSSPIKRAMNTARPIAKKIGKSVHSDVRLVEIDHGTLSGQAYDVTIEHFGLAGPDYISTYKYDFSDFDGESYKQTRARIRSFISDLKKQNYKTVLIVTHGGPVRWFYYLLKGEKVGLLSNSQLHIFEI